jgi:hypothetical protein
LLLARPTVNPPLAAAAFSETVQASVPAPVIDVLEQESPVRTGMPVPLSATVIVLLVEELLARVSVPVAAPAAVGLNRTVSAVVWFGLSVSGRLAPESEKPAPLIVAVLITAGTEPVEETVIDCVVAVFTATAPKFRFEEPTLSAGTAAFNSNAKDSEPLPSLAPIAADCVVETAATVAVKLALVAPSATVTDAGTATAESLLVRLAVNPPLSAAMLRVIVHAFAPEPVMDDWAQLSAVSIGMRTPQQ